jgi:hypothetical protein
MDLNRLGRLEGVFIELVNITEGARLLYGSKQAADMFAGREMEPEEWRWIITYPDGHRAAMADGLQLDADTVAAEAKKHGASTYAPPPTPRER